MYKSLLSLVASALLALQAVDPASAAWTVSATGSGSALGDTLAAPPSVSVSWDPVVHVSWTASASAWAAGYRVLRSVDPAGPWTQVADVGPTTTTADDAPGAGTHYYAVTAYRNAWTSALSDVVVRADPTYVLKGSSTYTGATCSAATGGTFDMQQGWSTTGGTEQRRRRQDGGFAFCTDVFSAGQTLAAGTSTLSAYVSNTNGADCLLTATLSVNGSTALGSAVLRIPKTTKRLMTLSVETGAAAFADGDRVRLAFAWDATNACNDSYFSWNSTGSPASLALTG